jgi:hypothetical protein
MKHIFHNREDMHNEEESSRPNQNKTVKQLHYAGGMITLVGKFTVIPGDDNSKSTASLQPFAQAK